MENIKIEGTDHLPEIDFDFGLSRFLIGGYSVPENVKVFYDPVITPLETYLSSLEGGEVEFDIRFIYFHSSTAQILYNLFDALESCAANGNRVTVNWHYETDDEDMQEAGEDFGEELENARFQLHEIDPA